MNSSDIARALMALKSAYAERGVILVCVADNRPAPVPAAFIDGIDAWMIRA